MPQINEDSIIPYILGTLSEVEMASFESTLATDAVLAQKVDAARRTLAPLDAWKAPLPPTTLVDNILIQATMTTPLEYVASSSAMSPTDSQPTGGRNRFRLRELIAIAACIALMVSLYIPSMSSMRQKQLRNACQVNMAGFGQGLMTYANENNGNMPSVGMSPNSNWLNDPNRRHLLPAVRHRFVLPKHLICPAADGTIDEAATMKNIEGFLRRTDLPFWAVPNANGPVPRINIRINVPLAADANPLFQDGKFNRGVDGTLTPNSRTHGGKGQNVLFNDGSTRFIKTPILDQNDDNIWTANDIEEYQGTEAQQSATDAFLTP
ncbi:MAG: hypothetical protein DHS20C16_00260 [Phycisphaerae bacterium]|nr:MAG: hypothetical protein DHS20C16_00260 [Phycisphaerae bacterium]